MEKAYSAQPGSFEQARTAGPTHLPSPLGGGHTSIFAKSAISEAARLKPMGLIKPACHALHAAIALGCHSSHLTSPLMSGHISICASDLKQIGSQAGRLCASDLANY